MTAHRRTIARRSPRSGQPGTGQSGTGERGSGSALAAGVVVCIGVTAFWAGLFGAWIGCSHHARSAADLTALAAAHAYARGAEPCPEAIRIARSNAASLHRCSLTVGGQWQPGDRPAEEFIIEVTVEVPLAPHVPGAPQSLQGRATAGRADLREG
ncbi:helicase/secretion neighborhood TadE-like protein [Propionibacterium cyclohexanicum]|uniref:Helicase/secretion neighborhood TadE-like protein n=1 Tax=Propionibacterium cyclohexanicum TaxID=64702 RepID=A0A1H9RVX3_9ACTN|nr:Rv3654c family TadE-like protein [Propionibacterium cyclohexanicum]SER76797.1 helicase/secretion neighborhood TadE-like protein [Propionibacterium cyclohexanicum]